MDTIFFYISIGTISLIIIPMGLIFMVKFSRERKRMDLLNMKSAIRVDLNNTGSLKVSQILLTQEGMNNLIEKFKECENYKLDHVHLEFYSENSDVKGIIQFRVVSEDEFKLKAKLTISSILIFLIAIIIVLGVGTLAAYGLFKTGF